MQDNKKMPNTDDQLKNLRQENNKLKEIVAYLKSELAKEKEMRLQLSNKLNVAEQSRAELFNKYNTLLANIETNFDQGKSPKTVVKSSKQLNQVLEDKTINRMESNTSIKQKSIKTVKIQCENNDLVMNYILKKKESIKTDSETDNKLSDDCSPKSGDLKKLITLKSTKHLQKTENIIQFNAPLTRKPSYFDKIRGVAN